MKYYINFRYHNLDIETIDETNSFKEAIFLLKNYRMSGDGSYWISKRATKEYYKH
tara:strand:+ start:1569 stop:1733 length:165 start_codon:yes stop_codon:yes gene_type:complete